MQNAMDEDGISAVMVQYSEEMSARKYHCG